MSEQIGIIGASHVGRSWAIVFARAGHDVRLWDADPAKVGRALAWLPEAVRELRDAGLVAEEPAGVVARVEGATSLQDAVADADYVQECVVERLEVKRDVFGQLDAAAPPECVLASSSSTFRTSRFAAELAGRHRCLVAHPINPPHLAPIVELAPADFTSPEIVVRAHDLHRNVGQEPIVVRREIDGFVFNRLQAALLAEAWRLVEDGVASVADIDATVRFGLGLRWALMGPFETIDLNVDGGVSEYGRTYGPLMQGLVAGRPYEQVDDATVAEVDRQRRTILPAIDLEARARWRDRRLAHLLVHLRDAEAAERRGHPEAPGMREGIA